MKKQKRTLRMCCFRADGGEKEEDRIKVSKNLRIEMKSIDN
jgi:hypothetical protein